MRNTEITAGIHASIPTLGAVRSREADTRGRDLASRRIASATLLRRCFSFPALLGAVLVAGAATSARAFLLDPDVWWHIKVGQGILATHQWPTVDLYSFTAAGKPWLAYEWLGDVALAATSHVGGIQGLEALLVVLGSAIMLAMYALGTLRSGNSKAGFVAAAILFIPAAVSFNLRPQMLGYLFLVITLIVLERFRQGKRATLWLLPALMVVWVNTHGSWIIGLGTIGVYLASGLMEFRLGDIEARRWDRPDRLRLASVFVLCIGATVITPYGAGLLKSPFEFAFALPVNIGNIEEWQSMPFDMAMGKTFLAVLLIFMFLRAAYRFSCRLEEIALFLAGTALACMHVRFLLVFVPFCVPLLATMLARWVPPYEKAKDRYWLNALLMAVLLALVLRYFPSQAGLEKIVAGRFPVGAVEYLNHHSVPGPMFNNYAFGGYLVWSRAPEFKVFIDGRGDLYERAGVMADVVNVINIKPDTLAILQKYGVQSCLLERDEPLATFLTSSPDWRQIYKDHTSVLFVRREGPLASSGGGSSVGLLREHGS
jgi:hypothetical protein